MEMDIEMRLMRMEELINSFDTLAYAATISGVTTDTLRNYTTGRTPPKLEPVAKLCEAAAMSLDYVWFGGAARKYFTEETGADYNTNGEFVFVDKLNVIAEAGNGLTVEDENTIKIGYRKDFIERMGWNYESIKQISVSNDSMTPTINDGDSLLIDVSYTEFKEDGIYVLLDGDLLKVKRLQRLIGGIVRVASDNEQIYTHQEISETEFGDHGSIKIRGKAVWREGGNKL